jgi:phosphoribosyl-ATP pyrophosphohydrolase/phosphoribosyl-AMP cyclohydrolase/histidinol dehydrogenase
MASAFLTAIDLASNANPASGSDLKALGLVGHVFTKVDPAAIDNAFLYLQRTIGLVSTYFDVTSLSSIDEVVSLLDSGAAKVFVTRPQLDQLVSAQIDQVRLVLAIAGNTKEEVIDAIAGTAVDVYSHEVHDVELVEEWLKEYGVDRPEVYVSFLEPTSSNALRIARLSAVPILPEKLLTVDPKAQPQLISIAKLLLANATSDRPDGLFTTLVTDERGVALGLVYSNEESVSESLRTGRGVYQSRKRGLWYKGESSGDVQELVSISLDCDHDCLRFVVKQKGRGITHVFPCTMLDGEITSYRILPSGHRDMFRTISRALSSSTNPPRTQRVCTRRLVHSSTI